MENIKSIREKTGMSRRAFHETFGIPERTIQSWEDGVRTPPAYIIKMLKKQVDDYCDHTNDVHKYFVDFMHYCFIMSRDEYIDYVRMEAYSYYHDCDGEVTLEEIKKSVFDVYREYDPETSSTDEEPHLYTEEQAWEEVSDFATYDFYRLEEFAEDIYKAYLAMANEEESE